MIQQVTLYFQYKSLMEEGFLPFVTATMDTEDPDEVGTTEDYIESVAGTKVACDPDVLGVYVSRDDLDNDTDVYTFRTDSDIKNVTPLFKPNSGIKK